MTSNSNINTTVSNALAQFGYTNIVGLTSGFSDENNSVNVHFDSATNTSFDLSPYIGPSQLEITQVVEFTLNQMGYTSISGLSTAWDTTTNILDIQFDSANLYVSAYDSNFSVSSGVMALDLDETGNVSSYDGSVYSAPLGGVVNNDQTNLTVYEKAHIKQTFLTIDSLEDLTTSTTVNDTVLIALDALGYSNVSGLVTSWAANTLTSTLSATSVYSDNSAYTGTVNNVNIVVTNDIYGAITSYSNTGTTADGYSFSYTQSNLNNSEVFVIEATNYALNKIDSVTSNDSFTDVDITVTYDELGNLSTYSNSMTHSGVGDVDTSINDVPSASRAVLESAYNEIVTLEDAAVPTSISGISKENLGLVQMNMFGNDGRMQMEYREVSEGAWEAWGHLDGSWTYLGWNSDDDAILALVLGDANIEWDTPYQAEIKFEGGFFLQSAYSTLGVDFGEWHLGGQWSQYDIDNMPNTDEFEGYVEVSEGHWVIKYDGILMNEDLNPGLVKTDSQMIEWVEDLGFYGEGWDDYHQKYFVLGTESVKEVLPEGAGYDAVHDRYYNIDWGGVVTPIINNIISITINDILQGTSGIDHMTTLGGTNAITAKEGNDSITLTADSTWSSGYVAKNIFSGDSIGTHQSLDLTDLNRFFDVIDGGADIDTLTLTSGSDAFFLDDVYSGHHESLTLSETTRGTDSTARIINLEVINAGAGNDIIDLTSLDFTLSEAVTINGEAGNDTLWSSNANDILNGGTGDDTLFGGAGDDQLTGGTDKDTFQFTASSGNDIISDFSVSDQDILEFYYRSGNTSDISDLTLTDGILNWATGDGGRVVQIDMSDTISSSNINDYSDLVTFVEIA